MGAQDRAIAVVITSDGTVQVERTGTSGYRPLKRDDRLYQGDFVRAMPGARGVLQCTLNSLEWMIPDDRVPRSVAGICP